MLFNKITLCAALVAASFVAEAASTANRRAEFRQCASNDQRSKQIKQSFLNAYGEYKKYAWGHDELLPLSKTFSDSRNGWGASIIDALDTMIIMGLEDEYNEALQFVKQINFSKSSDVSKGFETNIRYLGGLLAANDLMPDPILVQKAIEVTEETLIPLFIDSTSMGSSVKVPLTYLDVNTKQPRSARTINLAEFGTYSMEFTRLSQITGDSKYEKLATDLVNAAIKQPTRMPGLFPTSWNVNPFSPVDASTITVAGGGDSFYEYLIKNYILQADKNEELKKTWEDSVESMEQFMLSPTAQDPDIQYVAMIGNSTVYYSSQELICFWPGNILLGISQMDDADKKEKFRHFADTFFKSCIKTWTETATDISPESWAWTPKDNKLETKLNELFDNTLKPSNEIRKMEKSSKAKAKRTPQTFEITNAIYDLRPETLESIFYYYRLTGDKQYQDLSWQLYNRGINKYASVSEGGFTRVDNVDKLPIRLQDFQESFFFAETLKYLYLTFVDKECISLNDYVFNTEAHPFKLSHPLHYQS